MADINLSRTTLDTEAQATGFRHVLIGVGSFHRTRSWKQLKSKTQHLTLVAAIRLISSFGLFVVAGLIFGFDTDPDEISGITLAVFSRVASSRGSVAAYCTAGDAALSTDETFQPFEKRQTGAGRLQVPTNIRYLKPAPQIRDDFKTFVKRFNRGAYQIRALIILRVSELRQLHRAADCRYADLKALQYGARKPKYIVLLWLRVFRLLSIACTGLLRPQGVPFDFSENPRQGRFWFYFKIWLFTGVTLWLKYANLPMPISTLSRSTPGLTSLMFFPHDTSKKLGTDS